MLVQGVATISPQVEQWLVSSPTAILDNLTKLQAIAGFMFQNTLVNRAYPHSYTEIQLFRTGETEQINASLDLSCPRYKDVQGE